MTWTEPKPPTKDISSYDHVMCDTPLGKCLIEWKGWKDYDSYTVMIGDEWIAAGCDLDEAKSIAKEWLTNKHKELSELLGL